MSEKVFRREKLLVILLSQNKLWFTNPLVSFTVNYVHLKHTLRPIWPTEIWNWPISISRMQRNNQSQKYSFLLWFRQIRDVFIRICANWANLDSTKYCLMQANESSDMQHSTVFIMRKTNGYFPRTFLIKFRTRKYLMSAK